VTIHNQAKSAGKAARSRGISRDRLVGFLYAAKWQALRLAVQSPATNRCRSVLGEQVTPSATVRPANAP
jgi:hypothetical protein